MKVRVAGKTDIGRVRERNEDSLLTQEPLFAVADGLGGHLGGEVASSLALETLANVKSPAELPDGVRKANQAVFERAAGDPKLAGMGTTLTAVFGERGEFHLAHVGDSRAYLLRDGEFTQITDDHTVVQEAVREGRLTAGEAQIHPQRSILTRALGVEADVDVDEATQTVRAGDRILLCTDGLTGMLSDATIQGILEAEKDTEAAADALIEGAVDEGGIDNVTAVVIDVLDADGEGPPPETTRDVRAPTERGTTKETAPPPLDVTGVRGRPADDTTGVMKRPRGETGGVRTRPRDETGVIIAQPTLREPAPRKKRWPKRLVLWGLIPVAILGGAAFGARVWIDSQFFVGVHEERVALFQGVPSEILGYRLFEVIQDTDLSATRVERLGPWRELRNGITAGSEEEGRDLIRQMRQDLKEAPSPGR